MTTGQRDRQAGRDGRTFPIETFSFSKESQFVSHFKLLFKAQEFRSQRPAFPFDLVEYRLISLVTIKVNRPFGSSKPASARKQV